MAGLKRAKSEQPVAVRETSKGEGPVWYKSYDIKWLKREQANHPDGNLVDEYEEKYGVIL